jgi:2-oxo-3-hexenedioate decarboxylase/2-keto-4-pentenoate hydratase
MSINVEAAAQILSRGRLEKQRIGALPDGLRPRDAAEGYVIQDALHDILSPTLGRISGHKIGCTTAVMQRFLNINSPCAGMVFERCVSRGATKLPHAEFVRAGVECEIAVGLGVDLPPRGNPHDFASVAAAVEWLAAAIEVVDDRYENYKSLDTPTLIADDFFDAACVIAPPTNAWQALPIANLNGRTFINGVEVGRGKAGDVMGHPFHAVAWLANALNQRGHMLRAGEFVMSGSVVETRWVAPGDHVVVSIDHLGQAEARFSA